MRPTEQSSAIETVVHIIGWVIAVGLLFVNLLLFRRVVMDVMTLTAVLWASTNPGQWRESRLTFGWIRATLDYVLLLVGGAVTVMAAIGVEYYLRKGLAEGQLYRRLGRIMGIGLALAAGLALISLLLNWLVLRIPV